MAPTLPHPTPWLCTAAVGSWYRPHYRCRSHDLSWPQPCPKYHSFPIGMAAKFGMNEAQLLATQSLRIAFSHLDSDCTIAAWLTADQEKSLTAYRLAFALLPISPEAPLPESATPQEVDLVSSLMSRLREEGHLQGEQERAYATDLRLLQYLRARDHHMGANCEAMHASPSISMRVSNCNRHTLAPFIRSEKAHAMLLSTLSWRAEHSPWKLENEASRTEKNCSDARIVGYDRQGRWACCPHDSPIPSHPG